jgi:hypothetical protein
VLLPGDKNQFQAFGTRIAYMLLFVKTVLSKHKQRKAIITMKTFKTLGLLAAGLLCSAGLANATAIVSSNTLANLENGGSLAIGDKIFSGFSATESGLTSFNASAITVTATVVGNVDYLTWGGNISLASLGSIGTYATADLLLNYVVTATGGNKINEIDQNYTGTVASGAGTVGIAETVTTPGGGGAIVGSTYLNATYTYEPNLTDVPVSLNSSSPFINPPQPVLDVTKDIGLTVYDLSPVPGFEGLYSGSVSVSQIQQSFHQGITVPDGGMTVSLLGIALMGCGLLRWKQSK